MAKIRKFINTKGFAGGILYLLLDTESLVVTNVYKNRTETFHDPSKTLLQYAEKFCVEGSWQEQSYEAPLTKREEALVKALKHLDDLWLELPEDYVDKLLEELGI